MIFKTSQKALLKKNVIIKSVELDFANDGTLDETEGSFYFDVAVPGVAVGDVVQLHRPLVYPDPYINDAWWGPQIAAWVWSTGVVRVQAWNTGQTASAPFIGKLIVFHL
jgi:hypothetical protein